MQNSFKTKNESIHHSVSVSEFYQAKLNYYIELMLAMPHHDNDTLLICIISHSNITKRETWYVGLNYTNYALLKITGEEINCFSFTHVTCALETFLTNQTKF